jgi:hypothetical protein
MKVVVLQGIYAIRYDQQEGRDPQGKTGNVNDGK